MSEDDIHATFWGHLEELRKTLLFVIGIIGIGTILSFCFYDRVISYLVEPFKQITEIDQGTIKRQHITKEHFFNPSESPVTYILPQDLHILHYHLHKAIETFSGTFVIQPTGYVEIETAISKEYLIVYGPIEGMFIVLKVCALIGVVATSPFWIWALLSFIAPAFHRHQKKAFLMFVSLSFLFMCAGAFFAFTVTIPIANQYLYAFNALIGTNLWSLSQYLDYTLILMLSTALAFECGLILFGLVHWGIIQERAMREKRRYVIVIAFIIGALLTPPDILTQLMLTIPLIFLYEIAILYARFRSWQQELRVANVGRLKKIQNG